MNFHTKYLICLWKAYLDKGLSLTNYLKYLIAFFALASQDMKNTLIIAVFYGAGCFLLGYLWYKSDFISAEIEVGNKFNNFVTEVRNKLLSKKK